MKNQRASMFQSVCIVSVFLGVMALISVAPSGCSALDKAAPEFAGTPAATQPSGVIVPATARNVPAEISTVVGNVASSSVAQNIAASVPYGGLVLLALLGISNGITAYSRSKHKSAAETANAVIAAAQEPIAKLVGQVTDNATLATDVTVAAQVAPAIITLLSHPATPTPTVKS